MTLKQNPDAQAVFNTEPTQLRKLAYVASPYNHSDKYVRANRVIETKNAMRELEKIPTLKPYSPVLDTLESEKRGLTPETGWYHYDMLMLSKADMLIVLKLDDYNDSVGVFCEIMAASALKIPIFYITLQEILDGKGILFDAGESKIPTNIGTL